MAPPLFRTLLAVTAAAFLASCGGTAKPAATTGAVTTVTASSVLGSEPETVTFPELESAVARLYRRRPGLNAFVTRDVEYTTATRNKVLDICHRGGLEGSRAALESSRIAGCAPLIFFFYKYGRQKNAPDAVAVARKTYWYAADSIRGPFDARATLDALLRTWGVD